MCARDCQHECLMYFCCLFLLLVLFSSICANQLAAYWSHTPNRWLKYIVFYALCCLIGWKLQYTFTVHVTHNFMFEKKCAKMNLNEPQKQKLERTIFWQQVKHIKPHSALLQTWKWEALITLCAQWREPQFLQLQWPTTEVERWVQYACVGNPFLSSMWVSTALIYMYTLNISDFSTQQNNVNRQAWFFTRMFHACNYLLEEMIMYCCGK